MSAVTKTLPGMVAMSAIAASRRSVRKNWRMVCLNLVRDGPFSARRGPLRLAARREASRANTRAKPQHPALTMLGITLGCGIRCAGANPYLYRRTEASSPRGEAESPPFNIWVATRRRKELESKRRGWPKDRARAAPLATR